jgi:cell division protein ZapA
MAQVVITINNREYPIACENGQETRIIQLSQILEQKAQMLKDFSGRISESMFLAMIGILVADDLFEARKSAAQAAATSAPAVDKATADRLLSILQKIQQLSSKIDSI